MNRRLPAAARTLAAAVLLLAANPGATRAADDGRPAADTVQGEPPRSVAGKPGLNPRVLLITDSDSAHCREELARLRSAGGTLEHLHERGWKIGAGPDNHIQIVGRDTVQDIVGQSLPGETPLVVCIDRGEIVRSFRSGCTTPLDVWTFGFLLKGVDERPPASIPEAARVESTGHYPLRGNHWSIDEDWSPTKAKVVSHLRGPAHGSQIGTRAIEAWSYEELRSLHDNLHEQEMGGVSFARRPQASNSLPLNSASRKILGH